MPSSGRRLYNKPPSMKSDFPHFGSAYAPICIGAQDFLRVWFFFVFFTIHSPSFSLFYNRSALCCLLRRVSPTRSKPPCSRRYNGGDGFHNLTWRKQVIVRGINLLTIFERLQGSVSTAGSFCVLRRLPNPPGMASRIHREYRWAGLSHRSSKRTSGFDQAVPAGKGP